MGISRRAFLAGASALAAMPLAASASASASASPLRIAAVDWAMLETALALGIVPVAATELVHYRRWVVTPEMPDGVADLGLRGAPNLEVLVRSAPGLILSSHFYAGIRHRLARIAPVVDSTINMPGGNPYRRALEETAELGERLGTPDAARELIGRTEDAMDALAGRFGPRSVLLVSLGDARHVRTFGGDSLFGSVLERLGLVNAWRTATRFRATATVGLERLAEMPDATLVVLDPVPPGVWPALADSAIWQALPSVRDCRVVRLDAVNPFGGLPAARRFAELLARA